MTMTTSTDPTHASDAERRKQVALFRYGLIADLVQLRRMIEQGEGSEDYRRVSFAKLDALLGLCESAGCRRVRLLAYFGEASEPCGNCDTCLSPPETWDATEAARKALSAIYRTGQRFGAVHLIGVLRGMQLKKLPSVAETIDWGRTLLALGMDTIDDEVITATLGVVLKHQSDQIRASGELRLN